MDYMGGAVVQSRSVLVHGKRVADLTAHRASDRPEAAFRVEHRAGQSQRTSEVSQGGASDLAQGLGPSSERRTATRPRAVCSLACGHRGLVMMSETRALSGVALSAGMPRGRGSRLCAYRTTEVVGNVAAVTTNMRLDVGA